MPYKSEWIDPEVFMRRGEVVVYCMYKHDDCENHCASSVYFTTNKHASYDDASETNGVFDVRDIDTDGLIEKSKPVYMTDSLDGNQKNPAWTNASEEERKKIKQQWEDWHSKTEKQITKKVIDKAIKEGRIKPWVEKD